MICPAEVTGLTPLPDRATLDLRHGRTEGREAEREQRQENSKDDGRGHDRDIDQDRAVAEAKLVVFADGADSSMRGSLNFETSRRDYGQCVILTTVTPHRPHQNIAYERFTDSGPMALLPSSNNRYTVVWTARSNQVEELLQCPDDEFLDRLQRRFGDRAGEFRKLGKRKTYPLSFVSVKNPVRHRIVVAGNAAHTIHPVAGQGFNLGLRDVATLAEVLSDAAGEGRDIGGMDVLERYWQWRRQDTRKMSGFTDGLIRLFSNNSLPLAMVRDTALLTVDLVPPVQDFLVRRTMGLAGRLPRLTRGLPLRKADAAH